MSTSMLLLVIVVAATTTTAIDSTESFAGNDADRSGQFALSEPIEMDPLASLINHVIAMEEANPGTFDRGDLEDFVLNRGTVAAANFMNQRSGNEYRARKLAHSVLKWRKTIGLRKLHAGLFPCDLFAMGLIFESGRAHTQDESGAYIETNPVIWIRLGALGSIVKQLERFTLERTTSFLANAPRSAINKVRDSIDSRKERRLRKSNYQQRVQKQAERAKKSLSVGENETIQHVLRAIAWWLEDWSLRRAHLRATLVFDFENTDFAFASWSMGDFLSQLDDRFPDLFDQIIGFRYKTKMWSLHSPISMATRLFKTTLSTSHETDKKLRFASKEIQISAYMQRVDADGVTMLPHHVLAQCHPPNELLAPANCQLSSFNLAANQNHLFDPNLWQGIYNEFYYSCRALPRA